MTYSLKRNLNLRILTATAVFALLASSFSGWIAFSEARELQDNLLRQVASLVDSQKKEHSLLDQNIDPEDTLVLQRLGDHSAHNLPIPVNLADGLHTLQLNGTSWRTLIYTKKTTGTRFVISQQTEARDEVAWSNVLHTLLPILSLLPILMVIASLAIKQSIKPIIDLAVAVDQRDESSMETLPVQSLPEEISPFIASINRLLTRLQRSITQQRRFVADAAHELRTPVTGLSLLADNLTHATTLEEIRNRIAPLNDGLKRIQVLIAQLLDLARLQGENQNQPQPVNVQQLVQDIVAELYPLAEKRSIDLGMIRNEAAEVIDIPGNLRMLIHNAIDNAIRYTPEGGKVDVSLFTEHDNAVFIVEDTGQGINENELKDVFEPFYRSIENNEPGNGLGLSISKEVAERLGGAISLYNRPEGGLCFNYSQALNIK